MTTQLRGLAAGSFSPDVVSLSAPGLHDPRQTVECRITRLHQEAWLTEIRVDLRLTQHAILRGPDAETQAHAWLDRASGMLHTGGIKPAQRAPAAQAALIPARTRGIFSPVAVAQQPAGVSQQRPYSHTEIERIVAQNERLVEAVRAARKELAAAFGDFASDAERGASEYKCRVVHRGDDPKVTVTNLDR